MLPIGSISIESLVFYNSYAKRILNACLFRGSRSNPLNPTPLERFVIRRHEPNLLSQTNIKPYHLNTQPLTADRSATHDFALGLRTPAAANSMSKIGVTQNKIKNNSRGGGNQHVP